MKRYAIPFIIMTGILWGTSGIFVHHLAPFGFRSPELTFARHFVSAFIMGLYLLFCQRHLFSVKPKDILLLLGCGLGLVGTGSFYYASMQAASVSVAVVLMYTAPVIVMVYSVLFMGEKLTKLKLLSVIFMMAGCCLVSGIFGSSHFNAQGIFLGLCSGISYSAYNIFTKKAMERGIHPFTTTFYTFSVAAFVALCLSSPRHMATCAIAAPGTTLPLLFFLGIFTSIAPYFLYTFALKVTPAGTATSLSVVEPMAATIFSVALLGETLTPLSLCGVVLILLAVLFLSRSETEI